MRPGVSRCFRGVPGFLKILKSVLGEAMTKRQTSYLPHVATMLVGFEFLPFLQLLFVASFSYVIMEQLIGICLGQGVAQSQSRASACPESWLFQAVLGRVGLGQAMLPKQQQAYWDADPTTELCDWIEFAGKLWFMAFGRYMVDIWY